MKKVFQKILPTSKESAAARLRRNNAPVTDEVNRRGQSAAVEITDSEDDGRSSDDDIPLHNSRADKGGGGGSSGNGLHHGVAESFEELMQEYTQYERQATADAKKTRAGRSAVGGAKGQAGMAAAVAAADADGSSSDGGVPLGQVVARAATAISPWRCACCASSRTRRSRRQSWCPPPPRPTYL